ncbi:BED-type domain-containing protein [Citrus sinensis]|nr:BED-type domain-containing protein [Citrus sinensis]
MIIMGELPLSFVDNKGFRHFCSVAIPQFVMPSRRIVGRDVMDLFLEEKIMLKSLICNNKQRVSLTTDLWTSVQNMSYIVITAHFIDSDWCLNRRIISFSVIEDHRGKTIGKKIVACLQDWGIERLFAITVDNASTNDVAVNYVTMQLLAWRNDDAIVLAGQYMHVRCYAHILNLIVVSGLNELHTSVAAIRNAVKMAEVDKPYEAYFLEKESNVKRVGLPGPEDWESARRIVKFFKVFYDATLLFSASLSVTSNLCYDTIGLIESSLTALEGSRDPWVVAMAYQMRKKFDKYWESSGKINKMLIVASILDPRAKMDFAKHIFEIIFANDGWKVEEMTKAVKDLLNELYDAYSTMCSSSTPSMYAQKVFVQNEGKRVVSEVERYLSDPVEDPSNLKLNVLLWWKVNGSKYPILEKIARDVLVVPVSTVASEFAFSTGRRVIDEYRSSLTPCMVEALICTENWLQAKLFANPVYNLQEDIKEQIFHMELQEAVTEDFVLDDKYVIPKDGSVNFMVADMGWDPKVWEDQMGFKPERFLNDHDQDFDITGSREIKMMPFGAGRRICPGFGLAMLHLEYFVANLVWNFKWKAVDGDEDKLLIDFANLNVSELPHWEETFHSSGQIKLGKYNWRKSRCNFNLGKNGSFTLGHTLSTE